MRHSVPCNSAATAGVPFEEAGAIDVTRSIDTLAVFGTGTLTEGRPQRVPVEVAGNTAARVART